MVQTEALIVGLKKMLKNRGSMTVEEVQLLESVIEHLKKHEKLKDAERLKNGVTVVKLLLRFLLNPAAQENVSHLFSDLIDKLL
jgi:hypothetical protein